MPDVYLIEIQNPAGDWIDITDYVDIEGFGALNLSVEDNLLEFRAGDVTLILDNRGDFMRTLFGGADPNETWKLRITRNGLLMFAGVVSLPGTLGFDDNETSAELNAFGYLALLNGISADSVSRTFGAITASGTSGTATLTLSSTAGLEQDDELRISGDVDSEEVTVKFVNSSTVVILTGSLSKTWTNANVEVLTTFHRRKTLTYLVQQLFAAAGIKNPTIDFTGTEFEVPVGVPINTDQLTGFPATDYSSGMEKGGKIRLSPAAAAEREASDTASPFSVPASQVGSYVDSFFLVDWRKYLAAEPATPTTEWTGIDNPGSDRHYGYGVDHSLSPPRHYSIGVSLSAGNANWRVEYVAYAGSDFAASPILISTIETQVAGANSQNSTTLRSEFDSTRNRIYYAYGANLAAHSGKFGYWDVGGAANVVLETGAAPGNSTSSMGDLQYSQIVDQMLRLKPDGVTLQAWRDSQVLWEATIPAGLRMDSVRWLVSRFVGIVVADDRTSIFTIDALGQNQTLVRFSDTASKQIAAPDTNDFYNWLCHFGTNRLVGRLDGQYVVISTLFDGVVIYADFSGQSIAQALAGLAPLANAVAFVDNDFNGFFITRDSQVLAPDPPGPKVLDDLIINQADDQVWEQWYGAVTVRAGDITVTYGNADDTAHPLDVNSDFVPNQSVAGALAIAYKGFYSRVRRERRVTVDDDDTVYQPLQRVRIGTDEWSVYEIDHRMIDREVDLRLVEVL